MGHFKNLALEKERKSLELFCGTKSFTKIASNFGFETMTLDSEEEFSPDICCNILDFDIEMLKGFRPDVIWASPPCTKFSVASMGHHWTKEGEVRTPKSQGAVEAIKIIEKTVEIIKALKPKFLYIENPRGMLRKLDLIPWPKVTVTYCQYGFSYMKPTDIWSNNYSWQRWHAKSCKYGDPCHEPAPRGSKAGIQALKNAKEKGVIPPDLINEILVSTEQLL